jgi:hypothetical protein
MNKLYLAISGFLILATSLLSCKQEEIPPVEEAYAATINILEPAEAEVISSGTEIHLEATFENDATIHHIGVYIIGETMGDTLYEYEDHVDVSAYYEFHEHTTPTVAMEQEYQVLFTTWDEDPSDRIEEHVHITITP